MSKKPRALAVALAVMAPFAAFAGDAGDGKRPTALRGRIDAALERATKALVAAMQAPPAPGAPAPSRFQPSHATLVAFALVRAGGAAEKEAARKILDAWWDTAEANGPDGNYELAIAISAMAGLSLDRVKEPKEGTTLSRYELHPVDPKIQRRLVIATRALIEGRTATDREKGCAWTYAAAKFRELEAGESEDGLTRPKQREAPPAFVPGRGAIGGGGYDHSNTQWSVLALEDAARAGVKIPAGLAQEIAAHFCAAALVEKKPRAGPLRPRADDAGNGETGAKAAPHGDEAPLRWGYSAGIAIGTPAMSFAGLSSLAVARDLGARSQDVEGAIRRGLLRVDELFPEANGPTGESYLLYSLEKALDLLTVSEVEGEDWFSPLAESVLKAQRADGLWDEVSWGDRIVGSSLYTLFLARATVTKARIVERRAPPTPGSATETGAESVGNVFLPRTKAYVNAIDLVAACGGASGARVAPSLKEAKEALDALEAEGHGRDACLLGPIGELLSLDAARREAASSWLKRITGRDLTATDAKDAGAAFEKLRAAWEKKEPAALRSALEDRSFLLPLRAFAANGLATLACAGAAPRVASAAESLAEDAGLATPAGERCARALGDALSALVRGKLPVLPRSGKIEPEALRALAREARAVLRKAACEAADAAIVAHPSREKDAAAWAKARSEVEAASTGALSRLVEIALEDPSRAKTAFSVLRAVTGELIPDDAEAWKTLVESR